MAIVEAKLRAGLLAVFLLMYAVRATTSAEVSYDFLIIYNVHKFKKPPSSYFLASISILFSIILLCNIYGATVLPATYRGDEMGTTETVRASSRCGGYPYIGRKLIPCRSLKLTSTSAPPSPTKNHQTYQGQSAPPPLVD